MREAIKLYEEKMESLITESLRSGVEQGVDLWSCDSDSVIRYLPSLEARSSLYSIIFYSFIVIVIGNNNRQYEVDNRSR